MLIGVLSQTPINLDILSGVGTAKVLAASPNANPNSANPQGNNGNNNNNGNSGNGNNAKNTEIYEYVTDRFIIKYKDEAAKNFGDEKLSQTYEVEDFDAAENAVKTNNGKSPPHSQTNNGNNNGNNSNNGNNGNSNTNNNADDFKARAAELLNLINAERRKVGAPALKLDNNMQRAAERRASELIKKYSHDRPDGRAYHTVFAEFKISPRSSAENIAYREGRNNTSMADFNIAFMNSPGHRANMLNRDYTIAGLGIARAGDKYYGGRRPSSPKAESMNGF